MKPTDSRRIKAIPTCYKGYSFRSRLEARWAVFFDSLEMVWRYEPEGFDLGGCVWYLPDFWFPERNWWVEIKPTMPSHEEWLKAIRLLRALPQGNRVIVIVGEPYIEFNQFGFVETSDYVAYEATLQGGQVEWRSCIFVQCRRCPYVGLESIQVHADVESGWFAVSYGICCTDKSGDASSQQLREAYATARQAKFYGQNAEHPFH